MKETDLRIGNLVQHVAGFYIVLTISNSIITLQCINKPITMIAHPDHLNPIPLTKEWLLKAGFKRTKNDCGYRLGFIQFTDYGNIKVIYGTMIVKKSFINSVHQLQNFYYSMTGEELEITEENKLVMIEEATQ